MTKNRLQSNLINYLNKFGYVDFVLPDGVMLSIGITQDSKHGPVKQDDYCWVETQREDCSTVLDRYSLSVNFEKNRLVTDQESGIQII